MIKAGSAARPTDPQRIKDPRPCFSEITQTILNAKSAKNLTFAELAKTVGCSPVFLAAVCYRQASPSHEQAVKLLDALGLDHDYLPT